MWAATDRSTVNQWVADVDAETEDEGADAASGAERRAHSSQRSSDQVSDKSSGLVSMWVASDLPVSAHYIEIPGGDD